MLTAPRLPFYLYDIMFYVYIILFTECVDERTARCRISRIRQHALSGYVRDIFSLRSW